MAVRQPPALGCRRRTRVTRDAFSLRASHFTIILSTRAAGISSLIWWPFRSCGSRPLLLGDLPGDGACQPERLLKVAGLQPVLAALLDRAAGSLQPVPQLGAVG